MASAPIPSPAGIQPPSSRPPEGRIVSRLEYLNQIGIALSQERDINKLLETILIAAKNLTHADGGTLYRLMDNKLQFEIVRTDSLSIAMGGTTGTAVPFYPIPLQDKDGNPNYTMIAAYAEFQTVCPITIAVSPSVKWIFRKRKKSAVADTTSGRMMRA